MLVESGSPYVYQFDTAYDETPGCITLFEHHNYQWSQWNYSGIKFKQTFETFDSMRVLLDSIFEEKGWVDDMTDMTYGASKGEHYNLTEEYNRKESVIVGGIARFIGSSIVRQFTHDDVMWMRENGKLKQLVSKLRDAISEQVDFALIDLGITPDDLRSSFTVPSTLKRIEFVVGQILE